MLFVFWLMVQRYGNILIYQAFLHFLTQYFLCGDSIHTRTYIYIGLYIIGSVVCRCSVDVQQ